MSIRKLPSGRYQVRLRLGNGERFERTLPKGATAKDAENLETSLRGRQIAIVSGRQPDRLIDEAIDEWVATSATSLKSYDRDLKYKIDVLRGFTKKKHLEKIPEVASAIIKSCAKAGLSAATTNRYLAALRRVANLTVKWGWTDVPYGKRFDLLPGERQRDVHLTVKQINDLADAADRIDLEAGRSIEHLPAGGNRFDPVTGDILAGDAGQTGDMIRFAVLTGLRRSEILRLKPKNIVNACVVLDSNTKSGKPRIVPLPPQAVTIAAERVPFTIKPSTLTERYNAARAAAGMPTVRLHDMRHAYAKTVLHMGAPLSSVRDLLGHSSLSVTSKYISTNRPDLVHATQGLSL